MLFINDSLEQASNTSSGNKGDKIKLIRLVLAAQRPNF